MTSAWLCAMNPPMSSTKQSGKNIGNLARKTLFNFFGRVPGKEERIQNQKKLQDSEVH